MNNAAMAGPIIPADQWPQPAQAIDLKQINSLTLEQLKKLEREYQAKADVSQRTTAELQRTAQRLRKTIIRKKQSASKV